VKWTWSPERFGRPSWLDPYSSTSRLAARWTADEVTFFGEYVDALQLGDTTLDAGPSFDVGSSTNAMFGVLVLDR
jgi:hypothetical protein